ncbi:MAG: WD40/YVTN/BNR-like repeat-containing protein [Planctomycetota bacterium]
MSSDRGRTWLSLEVSPGHPAPVEPLDFRDLEVLSPDEIVLMAAGPGENSRVFRTEDRGSTWLLCAINEDPEGFWDGIAFWDSQRGLLIGDPVDGKLTILRTADGGRTWEPTPRGGIPDAIPGEYAFAASGTSIAVAGESQAWIATGGSVARVYRSQDGGDSWEIVQTPISAGTPGSGIFSIAFRDTQHGVIVGGDYERPEQVLTIAAWTEDGGQTWTRAQKFPLGYRSGVSWQANRRRWVAVGPTGIDTSADGRDWKPLRETLPGFHSVAGNWISGADGRAAYLP